MSEDDDFRPATGIVIGLALSVIIWIVAFKVWSWL